MLSDFAAMGGADRIESGVCVIGGGPAGMSAVESLSRRDCRVNGKGNLHAAGSPVFPAGGRANPTLTTVAMSLRLGDHPRTVLN